MNFSKNYFLTKETEQLSEKNMALKEKLKKPSKIFIKASLQGKEQPWKPKKKELVRKKERIKNRNSKSWLKMEWKNREKNTKMLRVL